MTTNRLVMVNTDVASLSADDLSLVAVKGLLAKALPRPCIASVPQVSKLSNNALGCMTPLLVEIAVHNRTFYQD